jgi:AraC-like DNA-binding protein
MRRPVAWYREFAPCDALRADVYAFFTFVPQPRQAVTARPLLREVAFDEATFCSPQLADGQVSLLFELGQTCDATGRWTADASPRGTVVGPLSQVGRTEGTDRPEMLGVYFRPARAASFVRVPMSDLADTSADIASVWRGSASLAGELRELDEMPRIDRLESILLSVRSTGRAVTGPVAVERLAAEVVRRGGRSTVESLAHDAGVSRQHLTRLFREHVGVGPKLYGRLARFQAGLVYAGAGAVDWAEAALHLGYADQSHMIAEVREFSGLTPQALASRAWFHPFIERARPRQSARSASIGLSRFQTPKASNVRLSSR